MVKRREIEDIGHKLIVAHVVEACHGGMATFMLNILAAQKQDDRIGAVHLIADPENLDGNLRDIAETHSYRSSRNPMRAFSIARAIRSLLAEIQPDVVFLHSTFPGVWGRIWRQREWKIIYCAHGWSFTQRVSKLARNFYGYVEALLSKRCDAIVSISHSEFNNAVAMGVRPPIHEVIHHGVVPSSSTGIRTLELKRDAINLAFVGRFDRQKGIDVIFKIFDCSKLCGIDVWFVGRSILGKEKKLPQKNNFHFLGWRTSHEIDSILSQVDALIVPSRWEGFGLVALEAMRNGKPVIANRVGGLEELIIDGANGRFIDIYDIDTSRAILVGLTKNELSKMGRESLKIYEQKFRWDLSYERWRSLLEKLT